MRFSLSGKPGLAAAAAFVLAASGAQAQEPAAAVCEAASAPLEEGGENYLQVACGGAGVVLGQVDEYRLVQLPSLEAAVAITSLEGVRRAWLIMRDGEGSVVLEEITGTVARLGGRGARRDIEGLEIDFGDLNTGQLTALIRSQGRQAVTLDLAGLVERSRTARASAAAGDTN